MYAVHVNNNPQALTVSYATHTMYTYSGWYSECRSNCNSFKLAVLKDKRSVFTNYRPPPVHQMIALWWRRAHLDYGRDSWQQTPLAETTVMPCRSCSDSFHYGDRSMNSFPALVCSRISEQIQYKVCKSVWIVHVHVTCTWCTCTCIWSVSGWAQKYLNSCYMVLQLAHYMIFQCIQCIQ